MAYQCDICGKKSQAGRQHTHKPGIAGGQWKKRAPVTLRSFRPNLHWVTLPFGGVMQRAHACTSCIKRARFDLHKAARLKAIEKPVVATA